MYFSNLMYFEEKKVFSQNCLKTVSNIFGVTERVVHLGLIHISILVWTLCDNQRLSYVQQIQLKWGKSQKTFLFGGVSPNTMVGELWGWFYMKKLCEIYQMGPKFSHMDLAFGF